jgi:hypothetical protein
MDQEILIAGCDLEHFLRPCRQTRRSPLSIVKNASVCFCVEAERCGQQAKVVFCILISSRHSKPSFARPLRDIFSRSNV